MDNFDLTALISVSRQGDDDAKAELVGHFRDYAGGFRPTFT